MSANPGTTAPTGRKKTIGHRSSVIGDPAKPPAALGHTPQNTSSPEGAKQGAWQTVPLGEIAEVKLGKMLDKAKHQTGRKFPYLRNINVRWGTVDTGDVFEMHFEDDQVERFSLCAGDVLVCEGGEPGRAAVWNGHVADMKFQKAIHRVRFKVPFEARLLVYLLESLAKSGGLERRFTGSTIKHFTRESFLQLPIPVPPLPEQRRIVAEIEKQFTRLEAGVAALRRVQANLKRYRAAVLKAACEGRLVPTEAELQKSEGRGQKSKAKFETGAELLARILTERHQNWQGRGKYKEPVAPDTANLPPLPEGWTWATVEQLGRATTGFTPPKNDSSLFGGDIPFFKPSDLDVGYYVREFRDSLTEAGAEHGRVLPPLSILVTCIGATIGKTGLARVRCTTNQQINALSVPPELVSPQFLYWCFSSPFGQRQIIDNASATTLPILNKSRFEGLPIPLPPLAEQTRIVAEVERRLSVVEELESVVTANLQRATRLRQSILQKAFTGELLDARQPSVAG